MASFGHALCAETLRMDEKRQLIDSRDVCDMCMFHILCEKAWQGGRQACKAPSHRTATPGMCECDGIAMQWLMMCGLQRQLRDATFIWISMEMGGGQVSADRCLLPLPATSLWV